MLLAADQGVLAVGAEAPVGSGLASGTGQGVVAAGPAVLGPSAGLEVPAAVECAPGAGQDQAAGLTVCRAWWSSNWAGLK
jgi:hypothetical protein